MHDPSKACRVVVGRLVAHPCGLRAAAACASCQRPVCGYHLAPGDARCVECAGLYRPVADAPVEVSLDELFAFDAEDFAAFDGGEVGRPPALAVYDS